MSTEENKTLVVLPLRLTNRHRDMLVSTLIKQRGFEDKITELKKKKSDIVRNLVLDRLRPMFGLTKKNAELLLDNACMEEDSLYLCSVKDPSCASEWFDCEASAPSCISEHRQSWKVLLEATEEHPLRAIVNEITETHKQEHKERRELTSFVYSFSSSRKLLEALPELKKLVQIKDECTTLVPQTTVDSVKEIVKQVAEVEGSAQ